MTDIIIPNVKLKYCALSNPRAPKPGDDPRYSTCLLISKENKEELEAVQAASMVCASAFYGGQIPDEFEYGIHDGSKKNNSEFDNVYYINSKSNVQPCIVVGKDKDPYTGPEPNGVIATVFLTLEPYSYRGIGISWKIKAIWIKKKGNTVDASVFDGMDGSDCDDFGTQPIKSAEAELNKLLS